MISQHSSNLLHSSNLHPMLQRDSLESRVHDTAATANVATTAGKTIRSAECCEVLRTPIRRHGKLTATAA